ncbi:hypothetical protein AB0K09_14585, partial [Streptomyces sp. NPDC049577]
MSRGLSEDEAMAMIVR